MKKSIQEKGMLCGLSLISFGAVHSSEVLQAPVELNGILGGSVTFHPEIPEEYHVISVIWILVASQKIIAVIRPDRDITVRDVRYQARVETPNQNYALQIKGLKMEDSGSYSVTVYSDLATMKRDYELQVFQRVPVPDINVTSVEGSSMNCKVTLSCTVKEAGEGVVYTWSKGGENKQVYAGPVLQLSLTADDSRLAYACKAMNPVSEAFKEIRPFVYCKNNMAFGGNGTGNIQRSVLTPIVVGLLLSLLVLLE
ncbi:SLAM family member 5 [Microcaecilia unicolor]|uniref:SLAM family member 5-like n=1 Tax=Microcaecilia unicolor TaxID=1415580 RepID=A0A6P7WLC0_9AMPH|nr:SLAM family member 5-like [Microcaecilia unicolor]